MVAMKQLTDNPEEDTQSPNLTDAWMPRRRTESPWFWVQLVGGSLVFHGALLAIALPLTARLSAASQSGVPTPVEFVELSEPSPKPIVSQPPTEPAVAAAPAPEEPIPTQTVFNETISPNEISFAPEPSPTILPLPIPAPEVSPSPEASPEPSPSPEIRTETPFETAAAIPQPDSLPLPVLPSSSPASLSPQPPQPEQRAPEPTPESSAPKPLSDTNSDRPPSESLPTDTTATSLPLPDPAPQPETPPSDPGLQTTTIDTPIPNVSESIAAVPSTVDSDNLNSANSEPADPVGVTLSLSSSSRVAPAGDEPVETLELARPVNNTSTFLPDPSTSACQVTPEVLNHVGTAIALQITTKAEQDKPLDVRIYQSSGSLDYDQLATCLVKEWRFESATALNTGGTERQAIASDELLITLIINRS